MSAPDFRAIVSSDIEAGMGMLCRALRAEGLHVLAHLDVRDHFRRDAGRDFIPYMLVEAWSPDLAVDVLRANPDAGAGLPTRFVVFERREGETTIVAGCVADEERERISRVFARLTPALTSRSAS